MAREPGYCLHKPTGQAYVNLGGKVVYLGPHGTEESKRKYETVKAEWLVNRHSAKYSPNSTGPTMAEVCLAYLDHAKAYYPKGNEYDNFEMAVLPISELYSMLPAGRFGPTEYRTVRQWWLNRKTNRPSGRCSRKTINDQMGRLKRVIKWAVSEGMIPVSVYETLRCVDPLKRGRSEAPESEPVRPVSDAVVELTLKNLTKVVGDMVRVQRLLGCRPGELVKITPGMIDRTNDVWQIALTEHKNAYRGKTRVLYVGPKAQAILKPYLLRGAEDPLFSPIESEKQRRAAAHAARKTRMSCGNKPGSNVARKPRTEPGMSYTAGTYARAIHYACIRAKVESWAPNQLRHSAATQIRKEHGLEAASIALGHSDLSVTQIYAEKNQDLAIQLARMVG